VPRHIVLNWVEEHPSELVVALENRTGDLIRDLEQRERVARRALKRRVPREAYEVPF
jgi:hypothetical protein